MGVAILFMGFWISASRGSEPARSHDRSQLDAAFAENETAMQKAVETIKNPKSRHEEVDSALDMLIHMGNFYEPAAQALLRYLDRSDVTTELRVKASKIFYLFFYDKRGSQNEILSFLIRSDIQIRIERLMLFDSNSEVRKFTAQIGQVLISSFEKADAEILASIYVPIWIEGLKHPSQELRLEIFPALENLSVTDFYKKSPEVKTKLQLILDATKLDPEVDFPDFTELLQEALKRTH